MSSRLRFAGLSVLVLFASAFGCGISGESLFATGSGGAGPGAGGGPGSGGAGGVTSTLDASGAGNPGGAGGTPTTSNNGGASASGGGTTVSSTGGAGGGGPICGDGVRQAGERCDGNDVGNHDCTEFGYANPGGLGCSLDCMHLDSSGCVAVCGNLSIEPGEECDDGNTGGGDGCSPTCQTEAVAGASCGTAIPLAIGAGTTTVDGSTDGGGSHSAQSCTADAPDIAYAITIGQDGFLTASLPRALTNFDSVLYASKACDDVLEVMDLTCNDSYDAQNNQPLDGGEVVSFRVRAGDTYFLFVDGFTQDDHGTYELSINLSTGADCANAVPIPLASGSPMTILGSNNGMPMATQGTCGGGPGGEVIYAITPDAPGNLQVDTQNLSYNAALYARSSCMPGATELDCSNAGGNGADESITVMAGTATGGILVYVDGSQIGGGQASGSYELVLTPP